MTSHHIMDLFSERNKIQFVEDVFEHVGMFLF